MDRLTKLKQYVETQLPNDRVRHALLELVSILAEEKPSVTEEPKNRVKRNGTQKSTLPGL